MRKHKIALKQKLLISVCALLASVTALTSTGLRANESTTLERFYIPVPFCVIGQTTRVTEEVSQVIASQLTQRFRAPCKRISFPMEAPFAERSKLLWREQAVNATFAFWMDIQGPLVIVRAFDLSVHEEGLDEILLQWSHLKFSIAGLSSETLKTQLVKQIDNLIDQYPYVGIVESSGFYSWNLRPKIEVEVVRRTRIDRHPFLPMLIDFVSSPQKNMQASLTEDAEGLLQIHFHKPIAGFEPKGRLWLKEDPKNDQR